MRLRRTAIAAVLTAGLVVPALSTAAMAYAQPSSAGKPSAVTKASPKPTKATKPVKAVRFEASGTVGAIDAITGDVTLQTKVTVKSGKKTTKKTIITKVTVAANARIVVNGAKATLANVGVGHRIVVTGTRSGFVYTATKVVTTGKKVIAIPSPTVAPDPTVMPSPSDTPSTEPSVEPAASEEPTSEAPTEEPSAGPSTDL